MIINLELVKDEKKNEILAEKSNYQPNDDVIQITNQVMEDFSSGFQLMSQSYREFNDNTVIQRQNHDQAAFNTYEPAPSDDPDEEWRSTAVRPITRNKCISIAAHMVGGNLFPKVFAQNENDQEDKDAAEVMRDLMEWAADQADYQKLFLYSTIAAEVNPAVIMHEEFRQVYKEIKEIKEDGSWEKKEVLDEELSGFNLTLVPVDELYIENIREHEIQRQGFLVWRRVIDYSQAQFKYKDNEKFREYVRPGVQVMFSNEENCFYEQADNELADRQVEEVIYYNKQLDLQLTFVNGVLLDDPDNPNPRKDKLYPFAKTGYELIDEGKFFYYKSLCFKLAPDSDIVDEMYRLAIDTTWLRGVPPVAVTGVETVGADVMMPAAVTTFQAPDTKITPLGVQHDITSVFNTLEKVESSIVESSQDPSQSGVSPEGSQTAYEISRLEQNARIQLGLFGRMMGMLIKDLGKLFVGDIIQHLTVGDIKELASGEEGLKYLNFLVHEKGKKGKTRRIEFEDREKSEMTEDEKMERSFRILEQEGGLDNDVEIRKVNPVLFRRLKFLLKISTDIMFPPSDNVQRALALEEYDRAIQNPNADQESLYRDLLLGVYDKTRDNPDKYIAKGNQVEAFNQKLPNESPLAKILGAESAQTKAGVGV